MLIKSVSSVNQSRASQFAQNKTNNTAIASMQSSIHQQSNQVAFTGLTSSIVERFSKLFAPKTLIVGLESATAALRKLNGKKSGMYAMTEKGLRSVSPDEFFKGLHVKASELVFKQPQSVTEIYVGVKKETHKYTIGLKPSFVIGLLEGGYENLTRVVAIVDDGMQVLSLPADPKLKQKALEIFKAGSFAEMQRDAIYIMPEFKAEFHFDLAKNMIDEAKIEGFSLTKIPKAG